MTRNTFAAAAALALALAGSLGLSACDQAEAVYPTYSKNQNAPRMGNEKRETVFGAEGLFGKKNAENGEGGTGIGVNAFLWRASLDTISFMPITSADAFGGTIISDWYQLPETPNERFKVNVFILDRSLRSDGVKVSLFKQVRDATGNWLDVRVEPRMVSDLENSILTRARQLRIVSTE